MTPTGRILNRFASDTANVDVRVWESWRGFLDLLLPMLGTLGLVCYVTPGFLIAVPPLFCFALRIQHYYRRSSRELKRLSSIAKSPMYDLFSCTLDGLPTIRRCGLAEPFIRENAARSDEANKMQYMQKICDRWLGTRLEMVGNLLCYVAMLLGVTARGSVAGAYIGLSLASSMRLARTVNYTVRQFTQLESEMTSVERIIHYTSLPYEHTHVRTLTGAAGEEEAPAWPPTKGTVTFEGVQLRYRRELPLVLKGVSFAVGDGEKLGVAGRTGSGKSSLLQVLFRLVEPCAGTVRIGGVDTSSLSFTELRNAISICPQDAVIFSGTIRVNLDPFSQYSREELSRSLERVGLGHLDIEADVQEGGGNLSGGMHLAEHTWNVEVPCHSPAETPIQNDARRRKPSHQKPQNASTVLAFLLKRVKPLLILIIYPLHPGMRQLLCLARTVLRRSKLLVLDEATSSVSAEVDQRIQRVLRETFAATTLIVIAHRLQTILDANTILVMHDGCVREHGSPKELLSDPDGALTKLVMDTPGMDAPSWGRTHNVSKRRRTLPLRSKTIQKWSTILF